MVRQEGICGLSSWKDLVAVIDVTGSNLNI